MRRVKKRKKRVVNVRKQLRHFKIHSIVRSGVVESIISRKPNFQNSTALTDVPSGNVKNNKVFTGATPIIAVQLNRKLESFIKKKHKLLYYCGNGQFNA